MRLAGFGYRKLVKQFDLVLRLDEEGRWITSNCGPLLDLSLTVSFMARISIRRPASIGPIGDHHSPH